MTAVKIKTRQEEKSAAEDYFIKAKDNYEAMFLALENGNYNAVGTLAVQCVISAADAICVKEKSLKSISQNHVDLCILTESISLIEAKEKAKLLKKIIAKKNAIQYERRSVFKIEAEELVKLATRFYDWVAEAVTIRT